MSRGQIQESNMATSKQVTINAAQYEGQYDCLSAAAADYAKEHDLAGWDLSPQWADENRDEIVLTVPEFA